MLPDVSVTLPDHGAVGRALEEILRARGNRPFRASEAYRQLADHFNLDWNQRNVKSVYKDEPKWHNVCRTAREHLVKTGRLNRLPRDCWKLTDDAFKYPRGVTLDIESDEEPWF
jgi:hypothetical protein